MTKLREDRRRKAPGTHLTEEIKLRVCADDHLELIKAARLSHSENLTGYARDCMFIGHRLQQGSQKEQILAALVLQQKAHALAALFKGEQLDASRLGEVLAELATQPGAAIVSTTKRA